jgi:hypothetical protein
LAEFEEILETSSAAMRGPMKAVSWLLGGVLICGLSLTGCKSRHEEVGSAPPPLASANPEICKQGGGTITDAVSAPFFDRVVGEYCVDPNGETLAYGEAAPGSFDEICTRLFNGECEVYKSYGLTRVLTLRYVDGRGSSASVEINLSTFSSEDGAYGFFTKRVIADSDPLDLSTQPLALGATAVIGSGVAFVQRGKYVAELTYVNVQETQDEMTKSGARILPLIAQSLADKLPGARELPPAAASLPVTDRLPLGISYQVRDALDVKGAGSAAIGFYRRGAQRWRVLSIERRDEDSAKDVISTFTKAPGYSKIKDAPFGAFRLMRQPEDGPKIEWIIARDGNWIWGVGDEEHVLDAETPAAELVSRKLDFEAKQKVMKALIEISSQRSKSAQH